MLPERTLASATDAATVAPDITRVVIAEALGAGMFTLSVIAAGLLAERFAGGNVALAMLMTSLAGACAFAALARTLSTAAPAAFNPALTLAFLLSGRLPFQIAFLAAAAQIAGAFLGVMLAHMVTNTSLVQVATQIQSGAGGWTGEFLATAFFVAVILASRERLPASAAFIGAGCLITISLATPSMSFANPALTLARALTDSFTSIRLEDASLIAAVQLLGALAAVLLLRWLLPRSG